MQCHWDSVLGMSVRNNTFWLYHCLYHWFLCLLDTWSKSFVTASTRGWLSTVWGDSWSLTTTVYSGCSRISPTSGQYTESYLGKDPFLQVPFILISNCFNWCCFLKFDRKTYFMIGDPHEKKQGTDNLEGLTPDPKWDQISYYIY